MADPTLFDRLDSVALAIATERFGFAFAGATLQVSGAVTTDPRVSPEAMIAGMCRAHAAGLASAIGAARQLVYDDPEDFSALREELLAASVAFVCEQLGLPGSAAAVFP